ncbi:uncharacterized protein LOC107640369 [Arachis ipaensis]|uniref:uncharacterized protein LOC107640369 n=1 Tax=Arachis ipaensis TaxID=130454 RepID=UPI0007AF4ACB|nr:uncharacterized protein LOC107640369 [Arachis ipaensis]
MQVCHGYPQRFQILGVQVSSTPMDYTIVSKLSRESRTPLEDKTECRQLVGRLLYLTNTRPDIAYAMETLNQFIDCPTDVHMQAAYRVLKYLKGYPAVGLLFLAGHNLILTGF